MAYGISFMNNTGGLQGWSWIFVCLVLFTRKCCIDFMIEIIEGLATIVISCIGAICKFFLAECGGVLTVIKFLWITQEQPSF